MKEKKDRRQPAGAYYIYRDVLIIFVLVEIVNFLDTVAPEKQDSKKLSPAFVDNQKKLFSFCIIIKTEPIETRCPTHNNVSHYSIQTSPTLN